MNVSDLPTERLAQFSLLSMMLKVIFLCVDHVLMLTEMLNFLVVLNHLFQCTLLQNCFLLGDPAAGKSTLAKNFQDLASSFFPSFFGQVSGVESHTAGIIPITIQSRKLGNLVVYDLAGHPEFYSSHMAIMHKLMQEHPAIFMCVIDLSKSDEDIKKNLRFWFNFIKMGASGVMACCQIVVVGSHADLLSKDDNTHKQSLVENLSQSVVS